MNTRQLNLLNIGLMIVSTIVAFIIPFELFLFSYAVLGPLHYLTEIGWLHKRNYFTKSKYDFVWLVVLGVAGTLSYFDNKFLPDFGNHWPFVAFLSALAFILIKENYLKIIAIIMIIISANFFGDAYFYLIFFAVFLPTIIHVFFFTGTFIFVGALKSKSLTGILSLVVFVLCAVSFFIFIPHLSSYNVSNYVKGSYHDFSALNKYIIKVFNIDKLADFDQKSFSYIFSSDTGYKVMRFIAFAYTYHYLNWFSKTSIIKWHKVSYTWLMVTVVLWLGAVGLYAADYQTGLKALFFLSFLHVFLEFPLNFRTFGEIGKEIKLLVVRSPKAG